MCQKGRKSKEGEEQKKKNSERVKSKGRERMQENEEKGDEKARLGKAKQGKARQGKAKQRKEWDENTRQGITREGKIRREEEEEGTKLTCLMVDDAEGMDALDGGFLFFGQGRKGGLGLEG